MANIVVGASRWFSVGNADDMQPGVSHAWIWGLGNVIEAITFTAHALADFNTAFITVENVQISSGFEGHIAHFNVRNAGNTPINQYMVKATFISE
jgi:hypothetical protein